MSVSHLIGTTGATRGAIGFRITADGADHMLFNVLLENSFQLRDRALSSHNDIRTFTENIARQSFTEVCHQLISGSIELTCDQWKVSDDSGVAFTEADLKSIAFVAIKGIQGRLRDIHAGHLET